MEKIKQFDTVLLTDGRKASVAEVLGEQDIFIIEVGSSPKDWDSEEVTRDKIEKVIWTNE